MKRILLGVCVLLTSCFNPKTRMIEVHYKTGIIDTMTSLSYEFEINHKGDLISVNAAVYGGNRTIATNVKYIKILQ